jgi:hypothetical protein
MAKKEEKKEPKVYIPKVDKTARNQKRTLKVQARKQLRLDLIEKCYGKLGVKRSELQKIVGTLNINRLSDVIDDIYLDSAWYKARKRRYIKQSSTPEYSQIDSPT